MRIVICFQILVVLLLSSCSSLPKEQLKQPELVIQQLINQGDNLSTKESYAAAIPYYKQATAYGVRSGLVSQRIDSMCKLLRIYYLTKNVDAFDSLRHEIEALGDDYKESDVSAKMQIIDFEIAVDKDDYALIYNSSLVQTNNLTTDTELYSYRLIACAKLNKKVDDSYHRLVNLDRKLRKRNNNKANIYVRELGFSSWALGYYTFTMKNYQKALPYLNQAIEADFMTENFSALAEDNMTIGITYANLGRNKEAIVALSKARDYYVLNKNVDKVEDLERILRQMKTSENNNDRP